MVAARPHIAHMTLDPDILIVAASLAVLLGVSGTIAGWADGARPRVAIGMLAVGVAVLAFVHVALLDDGLGLRAIPDAFIAVAAMILP